MQDTIVPIAVFTTFGWIAWVIFSSLRRYKVARVQAEVQMMFLSKFDSPQNMLSYVETESGRKFLSSLAQETGTPYGHILSCVRWGILLIIFGGTLCVLRAASLVEQDPQVFGIIAIALGVGCEAAAAASYFLYRKLGLVEPTIRP
jgi:hypothetical protein